MRTYPFRGRGGQFNVALEEVRSRNWHICWNCQRPTLLDCNDRVPWKAVLVENLLHSRIWVQWQYGKVVSGFICHVGGKLNLKMSFLRLRRACEKLSRKDVHVKDVLLQMRCSAFCGYFDRKLGPG